MHLVGRVYRDNLDLRSVALGTSSSDPEVVGQELRHPVTKG